MKRIKVAQIGVGHDHAVQVCNSIRKQEDIFDMVAYALPENEKEVFAGKLKCFDGLEEKSVEEILSDSGIDAVIIETEEKNLAKYALLAAKHNKHIHMDKPGGINFADFKKLVELVKEKKLEFHMGYMYRYNPEIMKLMTDIDNGELGEVFSVETQMSSIFPTTAKKRQWLSQFPGGMMFFLGCHLVDILVRIQGVPDSIIPFNKCTGIDGVTSDDFAMAVFEYPNGTSFVKSCAAEVGGSARRQIVVCGTKKTVEIKPIEIYEEGSLSSMCTDVAYYQNKVWEPDKKIRSNGFDRYDYMMQHFAKCVSGDIKTEFTYDYELMVYKCLLKACGQDIEYMEE